MTSKVKRNWLSKLKFILAFYSFLSAYIYLKNITKLFKCVLPTDLIQLKRILYHIQIYTHIILNVFLCFWPTLYIQPIPFCIPQIHKACSSHIKAKALPEAHLSHHFDDDLLVLFQVFLPTKPLSRDPQQPLFFCIPFGSRSIAILTALSNVSLILRWVTADVS